LKETKIEMIFEFFEIQDFCSSLTKNLGNIEI